MEASSRLRQLELAVLNRLDGILQGDVQGLLPGHGSDLGEARPYAIGDDVRRIDWSVTARTTEPYVRDTIVDRELETTLVVDGSGSMDFGTTNHTKRDLLVEGAAAMGFLATKGSGSRIGLVVGRGEDVDFIPHRGGRPHLYAVLRNLETGPEGSGPTALGPLLRHAGRLAKRRGFVVVISDFLGDPGWVPELRGLSGHHDVLALEVVDPREMDLPDVGLITVEDPETGARRMVDTGRPATRERYRQAAARQRSRIATEIRGAGADHLQLHTDKDWISDIVKHVLTRRRLRNARRVFNQ